MIRAWGQSDAARTPAVVAGNEAIRPSGGCASTAFALRNHGAGRRDRIGSGNARRVRERAIVRIIPFFFADCLRHYTRKVPVMRQNARVGCLLRAGCEKGAAGPYALENLYLAFSSSGRLMRILGSVVGPSAAFIAFCDSKVTGCSLAPLCGRGQRPQFLR
jgi:hypothetical protein